MFMSSRRLVLGILAVAALPCDLTAATGTGGEAEFIFFTRHVRAAGTAAWRRHPPPPAAAAATATDPPHRRVSPRPTGAHAGGMAGRGAAES